MTEPSPADKNRESDLPFIWHESEFDVAADLGFKETIPTGEFTRCEHIYVLSEFDCSQGSKEPDNKVVPVPSLVESKCKQVLAQLGAVSIILYVASPIRPDDFQIVCMPGVKLPEVMHGSIGRPAENSKRLITSGKPEEYIADVCVTEGLSDELSRLISKHDEPKRRLFASFIQREEVRSRARLAYRVAGRTYLALFVNFSNRTEFDAEKKRRIRRLFRAMVKLLPAITDWLKTVQPLPAQEIARIWEPVSRLTEIGLPGAGCSLSKYLGSVLDAALDAFQIRDTGLGTIHLYDRETHTLRLIAHRGHIDKLDDALVQSVHDADRPGIVAVVALKGKSILITDLKTSLYEQIHRCIREGMRSELAVPMLTADGVVGVINLESEQPGKFTSESVRVLWNAADQAAVAVCLHRERTAKRKFEECMYRLEQLVRRVATGQKGERSNADELAAIACSVLGASMCDLWHYNPRTGDFDKAGFSHPNRSHTTGPRTKGEKGWTRYIQETGWPVWITNIENRHQFDAFYWNPERKEWQTQPPTKQVPDSVSPHLLELGVQCELGIPICVDERCTSVAWLKFEDVVRRPSAEDVQRMAGLAGTALVLYKDDKGPLFIPSQGMMSLASVVTRGAWVIEPPLDENGR